MNKYIVYCSHGGLGNQLFQVLYARLYAYKYNIDKIYFSHNKNYKRVADYELEFLKDIKPAKFIDRFLLKFRIPKILERINLSKSGKIVLINKHILDNYFQEKSFYLEFDKNEIIRQISILKTEFFSSFNENEYKNYNKLNLYHFRLGDFFLSESDQINFINNNIEKIPDNTVVISNRDDLFSTNYFHKNNIIYLQTSVFSSMQMLLLFSQFKNIISNGSTLAFWGSVLGNSSFQVNNIKDNNVINLIKLNDIFKINN